MHIYAFGSVCRGEISIDSDVDLMAIVAEFDSRFDPNIYSVYSRQRVEELWADGNPFAWHLATESRLIFSQDGSDLFCLMGQPNQYVACRQDCEKFYALFLDARASIVNNMAARIFDLSMIFLATRNFATCFSLGCLDTPNFSRNSALQLEGRSLTVPTEVYKILERARILCTRGLGPLIESEEIEMAVQHLSIIEEWMTCILSEVSSRGI